MATLIASYLLLVFLVPLLFSGIVSYRAIPRGRFCPHCGAQSAALTGRRIHMLLRRLKHPIDRRWCLQCGWEGYVRSARPEQTAARGRVGVHARGSTSLRSPLLALDVRALRVDGMLWRVQLQWWRESERCQGRLVFIEPSGRLLRDGVQCFRGATPFDVLGQALSIPDRMLASRLRQLLTTDR